LEFHPDYLLYSDADIEHGQNAISTLIAMAERDQVDLASYMVRLHCSTIAERLLIPAFVYFFFQLYPPVWIADPKAKTAGAAGGCMLVRPTTLQRAGGIEAIRSEIIDDCALARIIKRSGGRLWLGVSATSRSLRPYVGFADIGRMIARTAFNQLHHSALLLLATCVGLFLTYLFPVALLWRLTFGWPTLASVARVGLSIPFAFMTLSYLPMVRFYRLNPLWALTLPIAAIFYMGATVSSAVHYWSGRGGQWKGRAQDVRAVAK
jgi:hopene-associated glycosyltransferase HpnB